MFLSEALIKTNILDSILWKFSQSGLLTSLEHTTLAVDRERVPECQKHKRRLWVRLPPPAADYFPSGAKSRWNLNFEDGTQPTVSPSCKESISKH